MGANAFAHESGIHQDGMLKNKETYEIITPEEIGLVRADEAGLVMGGSHSLSCLVPSFSLATRNHWRVRQDSMTRYGEFFGLSPLRTFCAMKAG